ncbi:MAG: M81 family metallopeptidase [Bacillota bacterium]|nr:M81 family metallopeptidase [Bacillota bacterium]
MRFVIGHISHETNAFSPIRTDHAEFVKRGLFRGEGIAKAYCGTKTHIGGFFDVAAREGVELIPTIAAGATPAGPVAREAYDQYLQELLDGISAAGKIDGVLLALHGAMMVEGKPDGEGDILSAVRQLVGKDMPVVSTLDLHANITPKMVANADALFVYDTYPHVDTYEKGVIAAETIIRAARGGVRPVMGFRQLPMMHAVVFQYTGAIPMSTVFEYVRRLEDNEKVIDICVAAGFPWSDFDGAGYSVVVTTDGDRDLAQRLADEVGDLSWNLRRLFERRLYTPEEAVRMAAASPVGPVVMADVSDNPGAGASCDSVEVVRVMVEHGVKSAAVAVIADTKALELCAKAGVGSKVTVTIGAKTDSFHGKPLEVTGRVRLISDGVFLRKGPMSTGMVNTMGKTVVLNVDGIEILLTEQRVQPTDAEVFRSVGIEPLDKQMLLLKSCVHYRAAFEPLARGGVLEVVGPGLSHPDLNLLPFKAIRRPMYPLDEA